MPEQMADEDPSHVISAPAAAPEADALDRLLRDLMELRDYLEARGRHTYELAQRFLQNARRDTPERAYDERQATMLEYQHYIWHEIAGRVDQLLARHSDEISPGLAEALEQKPAGSESAGEER
jgi:hypothetical protein